MKFFQTSLIAVLGLALIIIAGCGSNSLNSSGEEIELESGEFVGKAGGTGEDANIVFLHHSTGAVIWDGGVPEWIEDYNSENNTDYAITEQDFPTDQYTWENFPYDYWNIWVDYAGEKSYRGQPTLEMLSEDYDVIVMKHCFPVSQIEFDYGEANVNSSDKTLENYKLQYEALKTKMREFADTKFIVWTGAALLKSETDTEAAGRAQEFFDWVKNTWDEPNDDIFVWDFYELETEGGLYLKNANAEGDSHPNAKFAKKVAPYFGQRIVDVIEGRGDESSITGE